MDNLNAGIIGKLLVPIPPVAEQERIVYQCLGIEAQGRELQERVTAAIDLLREYRSALITAAVTGQLDIPKHEKKLEALA